MIVVALPPAVAEAQHAPERTVKVSWRIATPATDREDAEIDRGSRLIHLASGDCDARYRIDKLAFSLDATDDRKVRESFLRGGGGIAELHLVITKLYAGRGAAPTVIIQQKGDRTSVSLSGFDIDVAKWPRKGYVINARFDGGKLAAPKFWDRVRLRCE